MSDTTLYHNPRCSKSRDALALLREAGVEPTVVEYLKQPLSQGRLQEVATLLGVRPRALVRTKEALFESLRLDLDDDAAVLAALASHPELLERPIVVRDGRAAIGRPPENVRTLL
jgi:arsenate reductase (glutaredoxin)